MLKQLKYTTEIQGKVVARTILSKKSSLLTLVFEDETFMTFGTGVDVLPLQPLKDDIRLEDMRTWGIISSEEYAAEKAKETEKQREIERTLYEALKERFEPAKEEK